MGLNPTSHLFAVVSDWVNQFDTTSDFEVVERVVHLSIGSGEGSEKIVETTQSKGERREEE